MFSEGFEGSTFPPDGWTTQTSGRPLPHRWARTTDTLIVNGGSASALLIGQYSLANDEWLISPMVKVTGTDHVLSFFWAGNRDRSWAANATCGIRPKGAGSWTQLWSLATEPQATPFVFRQRAVDLTAYLGDSVQVAFRVQGTNGPDFALDDVALGNFVVTAQASNDHCAGAIPFPSGSFTVSGVTCYANNDWDPTTTPDTLLCVQDDMDGPDVVYSLNAVAGDALFVNVAGDWNPGVYLLDDCNASFPLCRAGAYPIDGQTPPYFTYTFPTSGAYFLVVDGPAGNCGPYVLTGTFLGSTTGVGPPVGGGGVALGVAPNPFRGTVLLSGYVTDPQAVSTTISIHDVSGRRVRTLDATVTAGRFAVAWDGRDSSGGIASAGVYFVRAQVGSMVARRAVILQR